MTGEEPAGAAAQPVEIPRYPLDDAVEILDALLGFPRKPVNLRSVLGSVTHISMILRGEIPPPAADDWSHLGETVFWPHCLRSLGDLVLRAVSPIMTPTQRNYILAFLEVWSDSVFADPDAPLRLGWVESPDLASAVGGPTGVAVVLEDTSGLSYRAFVDLRSGTAEPPALGTITKIEQVRRMWGTHEQLTALIALMRKRGPVPSTPAAVHALADATGLTRAAATLILAGALGSYAEGDARYRELGLDPARRAAAFDEIGPRGSLYWGFTTTDLAARALPPDPADLWEPSGMVRVARAARRPLGP